MVNLFDVKSFEDLKEGSQYYLTDKDVKCINPDVVFQRINNLFKQAGVSQLWVDTKEENKNTIFSIVKQKRIWQ